jgi:hypothetical protein
MLRILRHACVAVGCLSLTGAVANAQEVIHAITGTIRSIDAAQKTFTLFRDNGSLITFKDMTDAKVRIAIDKRIFSDATPASAFDQKDAYVIVFYYGLSETPIAVAVQALGAGPFTATVGTVASFNEKERLISVKDESGSIHSYKINTATVAESYDGVVEGLKFRAEKGDHVRVVGAVTSDNPTALFVNVM